MNKQEERTIQVCKSLSSIGLGSFNPVFQFTKLKEEFKELIEAFESGNIDKVKDEMGDIQYLLIVLSKSFSIDMETCLENTLVKAEKRRDYVIEHKNSGKNPFELWKEAKNI